MKNSDLPPIVQFILGQLTVILFLGDVALVFAIVHLYQGL